MMRFRYLILVVCCLMCVFSAHSFSAYVTLSEVERREINQIQQLQITKPNPIFLLIKKKQKLNKKITAAALAFPFPFGIVGLHRIYLGTKPHVPVVYVATLGGAFGLLPLVDFLVIVCDGDFEHYKKNGNVFMWIK